MAGEADLILRLQRHAAAEGWAAEGEVEAIRSDAADAVDQAVAFARASPFPPASLLDELYADG